jgi:hypothetical protein
MKLRGSTEEKHALKKHGTFSVKGQAMYIHVNIKFNVGLICSVNYNFFIYLLLFFTIYSRYLKRIISKRDGCEYLKQEP